MVAIAMLVFCSRVSSWDSAPCNALQVPRSSPAGHGETSYWGCQALSSRGSLVIILTIALRDHYWIQMLGVVGYYYPLAIHEFICFPIPLHGRQVRACWVRSARLHVLAALPGAAMAMAGRGVMVGGMAASLR